MTEQELLLLLRQYNLPACSVNEGTQVDEARKDFLAKVQPHFKEEYDRGRSEERERIIKWLLEPPMPDGDMENIDFGVVKLRPLEDSDETN